MKNPFKKKEKTELEKQIDARISKLNGGEKDVEKDQKAIDNLKVLIDARDEYEGIKINPNVIISAFATFGCVLITLKHEKLEVITSKAWSLIPKVLGK